MQGDMMNAKDDAAHDRKRRDWFRRTQESIKQRSTERSGGIRIPGHCPNGHKCEVNGIYIRCAICNWIDDSTFADITLDMRPKDMDILQVGRGPRRR
jgi:hypothetical protein